ncbi:MAG: ATP-binding cassette domain-containing protein [Opitutales bacterium]|nr:ATP-binding cassette domain-containing protein [Opitutales bacterium]
MLSCKNLTVRVPNSDEPILKNANVSFAPRAMNAVIGPSGCGKTTLVKAMLKIISAEGDSFYSGHKVDSSEDLVGKVGFAPQFTCVHPMLTVSEALESALDIAVADSTGRAERLESILSIVGLSEHKDKLVGSLSGGQLRRIGLAVELANNPSTMVCDEVTSGLDPLSENSILDLLQKLAREQSKTFICIIHNLAKLDYFDKITVVFAGEIVFQGNLDELKTYFEIDSALSLYDRLNDFDISVWRQKWADYLAEQNDFLDDENESENAEELEYQRPSMLSQLITLLGRRYKLFFRDTTYLLLTLGITFGFPLVVVIFSIGGLPQIESLALERNLGALDELKETLKMQISAANTSTIVTGLILFQVVLLSLIGANNSAREIAGERNLYEKERLIGLRPSAYAFSKIIFTSSLALFQGVWMCVFVKYVCGFPGNVAVQSLNLAMVCITMTAICLAFSAIFSSSDKANLVSIYLVGFQLPLSGVVLALPEALKWVCRPFISTYWGWAGYMTSMKNTRIYDAYIQTKPDWDFMPVPELAIAVLTVQFVLAVGVVFYGCFAKRWN